MNLRQMECFLAVADELHFRRAAERLMLAPASVSEAIATLERSLGGRLVERSSRRVSLTPLGAEFAAAIRQPIADLHRAHRTARLRSVRHRDVVIAHTPELGQLVLPRLVEFGAGVSLPAWRPVPMHTPQQLLAVADGEVDIGLCWSAPEQPAVTSLVLGEYPLVAVLRATDPLAASAEVSLTQLRSRQILATPGADNPYLESQFRAAVVRAGIHRTQIEEVARYDELVVHVATRGHVGVHPGPIALASPMAAVVFRPIADVPDLVQVCIISHPEARFPSIEPLVRSLSTIVEAFDLGTALGRTGQPTP